jgi:hypothetical protein
MIAFSDSIRGAPVASAAVTIFVADAETRGSDFVAATFSGEAGGSRTIAGGVRVSTGDARADETAPVIPAPMITVVSDRREARAAPTNPELAAERPAGGLLAGAEIDSAATGGIPASFRAVAAFVGGFRSTREDEFHQFQLQAPPAIARMISTSIHTRRRRRPDLADGVGSGAAVAGFFPSLVPRSSSPVTDSRSTTIAMPARGNSTRADWARTR